MLGWLVVSRMVTYLRWSFDWWGWLACRFAGWFVWLALLAGWTIALNN